MDCMDFSIPFNGGSVVHACGKCMSCNGLGLKNGIRWMKMDEFGENVIEEREATKEEIEGSNKVTFEVPSDEILEEFVKQIDSMKLSAPFVK